MAKERNEKRAKLVADLRTYHKIGGIDYTPEGIEQLRQEVISVRDDALEQSDFQTAVMLSHVIAILHWAATLTTYYLELTAEVDRLLAAKSEHGS